MQVLGKLRSDIEAGNAVLCLGAGVGIAAGLFGAEGLAEYLYQQSKLPSLAPKGRNLQKLVAALDREPQHTRAWINERLVAYFSNRSNYTRLKVIERLLLAAQWKSIFTTNFDLSIEFASASCGALPGGRRILPLSDPGETALLSASSPQKLRYFKLHGSVDSIETNPSRAVPLVLTQKDFTNSIVRNAPFWKEMRDSAYGASVIFVGFNVHKAENTHILGSVQDLYATAVQSMLDTFKPFAVLPAVPADQKEELEDLDINLLEGSLEDFLSAIEGGVAQRPGQAIPSETSTYEYWDGKTEYSAAELEEIGTQFHFYHSQFFKSQKERFDGLPESARSDAWKSRPGLPFLYSGRPIRRDCFKDAYSKLVNEARAAARSGSSRVLFIEGERAAGKSVLAHALAQAYYQETKNHVVLLNAAATSSETRADGSEDLISGWNARLVNKFLSQGIRSLDGSEDPHIPLLVADHCAHKQDALYNLVRLLGNHGKQVLVLLTVNPEESGTSRVSEEPSPELRLAQFYRSTKVVVPHALSDNEIGLLFGRVSQDRPSMNAERDRLLFMARASEQAARDILVILYLWFDKNFRRLEEIIDEESAKLRAHPRLMELYLSVAVFHQYNLSPRINLCLRACKIGFNEFAVLREDPFFRTFIKLSGSKSDESEDSFTRHPDFTRRILAQLCSGIEQQVVLMRKVLAACEQRDLQFVRAFFDYVYDFGLGFSVSDVTAFKEATEGQPLFAKDVALNHRFAAYLIREKSDLDRARYYLDLADKESPYRNSSITHSLGALSYARFRQNIEADRGQALRDYASAKEYFKASRRGKPIPDEYGYVTDCDMTRDLLQSTPTTDAKLRAELEGENQALMFEAMKVVPKEGQNYLSRRLEHLQPFKQLPLESRKVLEEQIFSGSASGTLIRYYSASLLEHKEAKNWHKLSRLVSTYENSDDIHTQVAVGTISKHGFLRAASSRFERLRANYDRLIKFRDSAIGFLELSEYIRLLQVDAFVLEKFEFLRSIVADVSEIFRYSFPRFLQDEYILQHQFYHFEEDEEDTLKAYYVEHSGDFGVFNALSARRLTKFVELPDPHELYFKVQIDPISRFYVRGIRKELATDKRRFELTFSIKHAFDGFKVTDMHV